MEMHNRVSRTLRPGAGTHIGRVRGVDALTHARDAFRLAAARFQLRRDISHRARGFSPRVLLLTSALGLGHVRTAQAIEHALRSRETKATIETLDFWSLMDEQVANAGRETYLRLVKERPELYDRIYELDQRTWRKTLESNEKPPSAFAEVVALVPPIVSNGPKHASGGRQHALDRMLLPALCAALAGHPRRLPKLNWLARLLLVSWCWALLAKRLRARVRKFRPDVIVATQMNPAALLSSIKRRSALDTPTIGVLTDFGVHDFWIQSGIDHYCVGHDSLVEELRAAGVCKHSVSVTGIPLMPGFTHPPSRSQARQRLGLDEDAMVLLVPGGGLGLGVVEVAEILLRQPGNMQVLVIAGHNVAARTALAPLAVRYGPKLRIWDWTDEIEVFMRAADIVIGKPGGLTVAESLACGRPMLAAGSLRGQEDFNVEFIERHGVGRLVPLHELADAVKKLRADATVRARIESQTRALGRCDGAERVADLVFELARARTASRKAEAH